MQKSWGSNRGVLVETTEQRNVAGPRTVPGRGLKGAGRLRTKEGCDWPMQRGEVLGCREASWFRATSFPTRVYVRRAWGLTQNASFAFLLSAKGKRKISLSSRNASLWITFFLNQLRKFHRSKRKIEECLTNRITLFPRWLFTKKSHCSNIRNT